MIKMVTDCENCENITQCVSSNRHPECITRIALYCDWCEQEAEEAWVIGGELICEDCIHQFYEEIIKDSFEKITSNDIK